MALDGKCPRCEFKAPAVSFIKAAGDGRISAALVKLPPQVQVYYFSYLSLFRPKSGCAVQASKAERLTLELSELIDKKYVSKKGQVDRPCPPNIWGMAMEKMMEQAGSLTLPLPNHNYLRSIAWDLADKADASSEATRRQQEACGFVSKQVQRLTIVQSPLDDYIQCRRDTKPTDEEMDAWRRKRFE